MILAALCSIIKACINVSYFVSQKKTSWNSYQTRFCRGGKAAVPGSGALIAAAVLHLKPGAGVKAFTFVLWEGLATEDVSKAYSQRLSAERSQSGGFSGGKGCVCGFVLFNQKNQTDNKNFVKIKQPKRTKHGNSCNDLYEIGKFLQKNSLKSRKVLRFRFKNW